MFPSSRDGVSECILPIGVQSSGHFTIHNKTNQTKHNDSSFTTEQNKGSAASLKARAGIIERVCIPVLSRCGLRMHNANLYSELRSLHISHVS